MVTGQTDRADLARLADIASAAKDRIDEIYLAVSTLFEHQSESFSERERTLATDILGRISKDVEMSIRIALAERLADQPEAPRELIVLLADDKIEVARPVLARSPVLTDSDLIRIAEKATPEHLLVLAGRPRLAERVCAALARSEAEAVIIALLRNEGAKIANDTFENLVTRARQTASLQEALAGRHDLPPALAQKMYVWVSAALKTALMKRYPEVAQALGPAIEKTTGALKSGAPMTSEVSAKKLIEKLSGSGQLKSSFLIRVLHQGQMELFDHGFAALLQLDVDSLRKALYGNNPNAVALACRAAGIDRSAFLTVFNLSRHHKGVATQISDSDQREIQAIFSQTQKTDALERLKSVAA